MLATVRRREDEEPAVIAANNVIWLDSWSFQAKKKKQHSFDLSQTIYSIIKNERVHDFVLGAAVGGGLKLAFNVAAHATGASWLLVAGAFAAGLGKAVIKQSRANGLDLRKWDWKDFAKTTALATVGGAFAVFAVPFLGDVAQNLTQNFNLGNMFAGLGGLFSFGKPEMPAMPSVSTPPVQAAPPAVIDAPVDLTTNTPVDAQVNPPIEIPAISEQWRAIEALAENGNAQAQKDMAMSLLSGVNGFEADADRAMELYRQAAEAGNLQAQTDLNLIAERNYRGMGDAAKAILEQTTSEPDIALTDEIAAVEPTVTGISGANLSLTFEIQADGSLGGFIPDAVGIVAPGTVFEIPVSQINISPITPN